MDPTTKISSRAESGAGDPVSAAPARASEGGAALASAPVLTSAIWVATTYFAEGFPYAMANSVVEVLFRDLGASLGAVGLTALLHLPWNLKFLWAPWMERRSALRRWIWMLEVALTVVFLAMVALVSSLGVSSWSNGAMWGLAGLFLLVSVLSASHDVAIDGHYMGALDDVSQARLVGIRAAAYRLASIAARGPLLLLVGATDWRIGLAVVAFVHLSLALGHRSFLPPELPRTADFRARDVAPPPAPRALSRGVAQGSTRPRFGRSSWGLGLAVLMVAVGFVLTQLMPTDTGSVLSFLLAVLAVLMVAFRRKILRNAQIPSALQDLLSRPNIGAVLLFVVTFRLGESFLQKMKWPFLSEFVGMTKAEYGAINGTLSVLVGFAGVALGGALISRYGLPRCFWPSVLAQNSLNLLYVGVALFPSWFGDAHPWFKETAALVLLVDELGSGFGTAVLMVYLMRLVAGAHKASEYALVTALMSFGFTVAGAVSGFFAQALGYAGFFALSFVLTGPMMLLAPRALRALPST